MSEINFLHKDEDEAKRAKKIKQTVMPITTAVLVVYFVLVSALGGWWWWWSSKQTKVSAEYANLLGQVNGQQEAEVLSRRLSDRIKVVNDYLNGRIDIFGQTDFLESDKFSVKEYDLLGGYFTVLAQATDSAEIENLSILLKNRYRDVVTKNMNWMSVDGVGVWSGEFLFKTKKVAI